MGAFISRPTSPQAIIAAIVWLYTKLFPGKAPVRPYVSKAFSISRENSSATLELVPVALSDRRENSDSTEDLQIDSPRLQEPCIVTSVELRSPGRFRPAVMSPAKKCMTALDDANAEMQMPTLIFSPGSELLDDSGISQSSYSDFTDSVGFPMHMLQTTSSLMKRRRKAQTDVKGSVSPPSTSRLSTTRSKPCRTEDYSAPVTSNRVFKAHEPSYLRQTASSKLKCRSKLNLDRKNALAASSCA